MGDRVDNQTEAAIIKALERLKADNQRIQENRDKRLWKKVNLPCGLFDAINGLAKVEMDEIRKIYEFRNLSSLKKAELAAELSRLIPLKFKNVMYTLDQSRYDLIKVLIKNSGTIFDMELSANQIKAFLRYCIIFPGLHHGQKVLYMPEELISIFSQNDGSELKGIVQRNTEWIRITHGLLYYHGVMDALAIVKKIRELTGQEVDISEYTKVMSFAFDFYGQGFMTPYGFKDDRVFDARKIVEEHRMRPNVDYYPFTKEQLLKAGDPDFIDKTPALSSFTNFLLDHYELSDKDTKEIAMQITYMINADAKQEIILQYLQSWFEIPSFEFMQQLAAKIMEVHNNTRQWVLKGHTPNELFQEERKYLKPLPAEPFKIGQPNSIRTSVSTRAKVGRNEPCPCGSGKKYKKCCGK